MTIKNVSTSVREGFLHLSPVNDYHAEMLLSLMEDDNSKALGWSFGGSETPKETIDSILSQHRSSGYFWAIYSGTSTEAMPVGFVGFYERGDEPEEGFSTKTYIHSDHRGKGINPLIKSALVEFLARRGVSLYSKISVSNTRSLMATYKAIGYDSEVSRTDDGYVVFEATKKAKERILYDLDSHFDDKLEFLAFRMSCDAIPFLEKWLHRNDVEGRVTLLEGTVTDQLLHYVDDEVLSS